MTKTVVISGGSRGLGLSLVKYCLEAGYKVGTFSRSSNSEVSNLEKNYPSQFLYQNLDLNNFNKINEFIGRVYSKFKSIDCLVNNAAIGQDNLLAHLSEEDILKIISTNLTSAVILTKAAVRKMLLQSSPAKIINISSICGLNGFKGLSVYSATKASLDAFTRSLAVELGDRNIFVNSIAPGFFNSELSQSLSAEQIEVIRRRTPSGKLTDIEQITKVFKFLLSEDANITGQVHVVDGGFVA